MKRLYDNGMKTLNRMKTVYDIVITVLRDNNVVLFSLLFCLLCRELCTIENNIYAIKAKVQTISMQVDFLLKNRLHDVE